MALAEKLLAARVQPARPRHRRPPHLCLPGRRLPDGRHLARGLLARRHAGPGQADRALRRQRHLDRRQGQTSWFTDDTPQALRGLRLERDPRRRRPRRRGGRRGDRARRKRERPAPDADLLQDHDRQGRAEQGRTPARRTARRWATRKSPPRARPSAGRTRRSRSRASLRRLGRRAQAAQRAERRVERSASTPTAPHFPSRPPSSSAAWRASCRQASTQIGADADRRDRDSQGRDHRHPQGVAERARGAGAGAAGTARRLGRPDRLQPHQLVKASKRGRARHGGGNYINYGVREFGMAAIMNGLALHGGFIPYGGTFLDLLRLRRNAMRMAALMKLRVDLRLHARLDRPGRGRPDAPAGRARGEPAPDPEHGRLASVRHGRDGGRLGARRSSAATARRALLLSRQNLPFMQRDAAQSPTSRAAATCCADAAGGAQAVIIATGSEVAAGAGGAEAARRRGHRRARGVDAVDQRVRPPGRGLPEPRAAARHCRASRSRPA